MRSSPEPPTGQDSPAQAICIHAQLARRDRAARGVARNHVREYRRWLGSAWPPPACQGPCTRERLRVRVSSRQDAARVSNRTATGPEQERHSPQPARPQTSPHRWIVRAGSAARPSTTARTAPRADTASAATTRNAEQRPLATSLLGASHSERRHTLHLLGGRLLDRGRRRRSAESRRGRDTRSQRARQRMLGIEHVVERGHVLSPSQIEVRFAVSVAPPP